MSMQAIHIPAFEPDPSSLAPTQVPKPQPKSNECLVRITHCSPQHADILHAQGKHQNNNRKHGFVHPPFILGFDFAGIIVDRAESLQEPAYSQLKKGDRVFGQALGAFAEYIVVAPERLRRIPAGIRNEAACAVAGQAVSYAAVTKVAKVKKGETVMVSGASGGLGSVCCAVAKVLGARVVALVGDEDKAHMMRRRIDVDMIAVVDEEGDWIEDVMAFTSGHGVDVMLDNIGMVNDSIRCLAHFGRIIILGFAGRAGVMEEVKMNKLLLKDITVIGYRFGESGRRRPQELEEIWAEYLEMIAKGQITPILHGEWRNGLEDVGAALEELERRRVFGKIVVPVASETETAKL
ncbi:NAD(P)-binding protein [Polychaeton citri CBS 116435]|uniref:NAD(P)-binding protein n=1 Tax=Polychaeton citri CBS 116435 TaxID=1314669 RepID=A0A9P4Q1N1_9PEZI|nr:NAD(P)-binding protein [Polychaeton citri CBS 116435]